MFRRLHILSRLMNDQPINLTRPVLHKLNCQIGVFQKERCVRLRHQEQLRLPGPLRRQMPVFQRHRNDEVWCQRITPRIVTQHLRIHQHLLPLDSCFVPMFLLQAIFHAQHVKVVPGIGLGGIGRIFVRTFHIIRT